jgi:hypothetical protein
VAVTHVVIRWVFHFAWHDGTHTHLEELAYQRWQGELIAQETLFYDPAQMKPRAPGDGAKSSVVVLITKARRVASLPSRNRHTSA